MSIQTDIDLYAQRNKGLALRNEQLDQALREIYALPPMSAEAMARELKAIVLPLLPDAVDYAAIKRNTPIEVGRCEKHDMPLMNFGPDSDNEGEPWCNDCEREQERLDENL